MKRLTLALALTLPAFAADLTDSEKLDLKGKQLELTKTQLQAANLQQQFLQLQQQIQQQLTAQQTALQAAKDTVGKAHNCTVQDDLRCVDNAPARPVTPPAKEQPKK